MNISLFNLTVNIYADPTKFNIADPVTDGSDYTSVIQLFNGLTIDNEVDLHPDFGNFNISNPNWTMNQDGYLEECLKMPNLLSTIDRHSAKNPLAITSSR